MDDSDVVVQRATELLLQQEGQHRQLVHRLQHQQLQLDALQQQVAVRRGQGEVQANASRLFEELAEDRRRLQAQNSSLLEKVSTLQVEHPPERGRAGEAGQRSGRPLEETRHSAAIGHRQRLFTPAAGVAWAAEGRPDPALQFSRLEEPKGSPHPGLAPPGAVTGHTRDLLDLVATALTKWEQARLRDDVYEGMAQLATVGLEALGDVCRCCARLDPAAQAEGHALQQRLQVTQQRCLEEIREKRATHRLLKRALREHELLASRDLPAPVLPPGGLDPQLLAAALSHLPAAALSHLPAAAAAAAAPPTRESDGPNPGPRPASSAVREAEEQVAVLRQELATQQAALRRLEQQLVERDAKGQAMQLLELMDSKLEGLKASASASLTFHPEPLQAEVSRLRAEAATLAEQRATAQRREERLAAERRELAAECQARAVHLRQAEEELREAHHVSAVVQQKLLAAEQCLQEESHTNRNLRTLHQQEQERHAAVRGTVEALEAEVRRLREAVAEGLKERDRMAETRREAGGPAPAAPAAEGEALRWREAFYTVSHFCESVRAAVQLGIAALTALMDGTNAARVHVPALEPFAHDAMTTAGLACVCRSVQDLLGGYIDTVNAFVRSLQSGTWSSRQRDAERRQQVGITMRRLASALSGLCRDHVRLRGDVKAALLEGKRALAESMHVAALQWKEAEAQHAHRWQEERADLLAKGQAVAQRLEEAGQALAEERRRVATLQTQLEVAASRHQTQLDAVEAGYAQRRAVDLSLRMEQSQTSLLEGDGLGQALAEIDRLRREVEAKAKEVYEATRKLDERGTQHAAELAAAQEQCGALLRRLCEAERENGALHRKCVAKEEEFGRLFAAVKAQRRPSPVRHTAPPAFSPDATLDF